MVVLHLYLNLLRPLRLWQLHLWLCNEFRTGSHRLSPLRSDSSLPLPRLNDTLNPEMPAFPDQGLFIKKRR